MSDKPGYFDSLSACCDGNFLRKMLENVNKSESSESKVMSDWKPIGDAPKDGTIVDLWHKGGFRVTDTWWDDEDSLWVPGTFENTDFTHYMLSPLAPGYTLVPLSPTQEKD